MAEKDPESTRRMLKICSRRAIDKLQADLDALAANPEVARQLIHQAAEEDLSILRGLYMRSVGVTLSVAGVSFFGVLPRRTRPLVSAAVAVGFGSVAGVVYGGLAMAEAVEKMVGHNVKARPVWSGCATPKQLCG